VTAAKATERLMPRRTFPDPTGGAPGGIRTAIL
jgi:hypothetical protein